MLLLQLQFSLPTLVGLCFPLPLVAVAVAVFLPAWLDLALHCHWVYLGCTRVSNGQPRVKCLTHGSCIIAHYLPVAHASAPQVNPGAMGSTIPPRQVGKLQPQQQQVAMGSTTPPGLAGKIAWMEASGFIGDWSTGSCSCSMEGNLCLYRRRVIR